MRSGTRLLRSSLATSKRTLPSACDKIVERALRTRASDTLQILDAEAEGFSVQRVDGAASEGDMSDNLEDFRSTMKSRGSRKARGEFLKIIGRQTVQCRGGERMQETAARLCREQPQSQRQGLWRPP
jgi:hypothetical protein